MSNRRCDRGPALVAGIALVVLLSPPAGAIDPAKPLGQCSLLTWRARDGLPGPWVRAIAQTPDGYLWVATYGGIARYDGARFVTIGSPRLFPAASDIADLTVAPDGRLWLSPSNGPPLCLRGEELESCLPAGIHLPPGARLTAVLPEGGGGAWIATRDELFHLTEGRLARLGGMIGRRGVGPPLLPFGRVVALREHAGQLLLATDRGLFVASGGGFAAVPGFPEGAISGLAAGSGDALWIAATGGLVEAHGTRTLTPSIHAERWAAGPVSGLIEDHHGNVWIASASGLARFRDGQWQTFTEADGLPDADVTAVFEDREGGLWVGTRGGGLAQFTERTLDTQEGPAELRREMITSVAEDAGGAVWLGTRTGVVRWQHQRAQRLTTADGLPSDNVNSVLPGLAGEMWLATSRGLVRWQDGHLERRPLYDGTVYALHLDRSGALWIGGQDLVLRWRNGQLDRFGMDARLKGQVRAFGRDDAGEMWLGAIGGLGHLQGDRFIAIPSIDGAPIVTTRAILADRGGTLWLSTSAGLIARTHQRFRLLAGADPALVGQIYQLFAEDDGHLWVGTTRGLARLDPGALWQPSSPMPPFSILSFDTSDRRRDATATGTRQPGVWKMRDGRLWFATDRGVLTIDPRHLPIDTLVPAVVIERAILDGRAARPQAINELPPGPGNLEFHFSTITLIDAHRVHHRYRLEGFDRQWVDAGTRRVAQYTNIPPGHYRFRVQGSNADGLWNEAGAALAFTLAPHFYATGWFYALVAATVLGLTFAAYRLRLAGLRRAYLAAFAERSRLARELHDTLLQEMSAIGMQLHGVRRNLERTAPASARELESVEEMVTMSLDETRRFVWNLREQASNGGDLGVALARLGDRLTNGRPVTCHTRVEGHIRPLPNAVQGQLFRIAQEAVANAVKHADAQVIEIALHFAPGQVKLAVKDDGRGFDPAAAPGAQAGHFGLVGMRERAARLGELTIDSGRGQGTRIEIIVPTRHQEPEHSDV
jgi:signal transduction histidine kinase/ligand-binding sensor domain-containing protein